MRRNAPPHMTPKYLLHAAALAFISAASTLPCFAAEPDSASSDFRDPDTGARILRLSKDSTAPSGVIYFTQPCTTADSRYTLVRVLNPDAGHTAGSMYRYEIETGDLVKVTDMVTKNQTFVPESGTLYFTGDNDHAIYATNIHDLKTRKVADMPEGIVAAGSLTVNADETVAVCPGLLETAESATEKLDHPPNQGGAMGDIFSRHETNLLLATDIATGNVREIHRINTWLGHAQFSPTDPQVLMYCHEGPWDKVDRIWMLRLDDPKPEKMLVRTEDGEIAGHEFWASDGKAIWYDHDFRGTPGRQFLEGRTLAGGDITRYPITSEFRSIHYTQSPDGKFFVCDGRTRKEHPEQQGMFILVPKDGELQVIKLCSMADNDYKAAEPNPHITPDQRWVTFTANFSGTPQAYAVELPREFWRSPKH